MTAKVGADDVGTAAAAAADEEGLGLVELLRLLSGRGQSDSGENVDGREWARSS